MGASQQAPMEAQPHSPAPPGPVSGCPRRPSCTPVPWPQLAHALTFFSTLHFHLCLRVLVFLRARARCQHLWGSRGIHCQLSLPWLDARGERFWHPGYDGARRAVHDLWGWWRKGHVGGHGSLKALVGVKAAGGCRSWHGVLPTRHSMQKPPQGTPLGEQLS